MRPISIAFFGSSLVSAYWNGAATYYRGVLSALAARGHRITFYEPDAYDRQKHRDIPDPDWARIVVYSADGEEELLRCLDEARSADLVVKASGVGVFDACLEAAVPDMKRSGTLVAFWDVDAPATLDRLDRDPLDPFHTLIPRYDLIFTYGGGPRVVAAYEALGARVCVPIYNGLDPSTHRDVPADPRFSCDLGLLANRLPDRESRIDAFFLAAATALPDQHFVLGGNGWSDKILPPNVDWIGHVYTRDHNAFNASAKAVLNVNRESMARFGFSPATRIFEAAGASACMISDSWSGIETFFEPGREILLAADGAEVAELLASLTPERARAIGRAAQARALAQHTYDRRVDLVEATLEGAGA
jgi:spore maturation protein CgeB